MRLLKTLPSVILVSALIIGTRIFSFAEVTQNQFYQALVEDISDSKYFAAVHSALQSAKSSIFVSLFGITISEHNEQNLPNILVQDLVEAHKRGVTVVVRLNKNFNPGDGNENSNPGNKLAYANLVSAGIDCKIAAPGKFLHDKLIVIDEEIVIEGSANWTFHALRLNHESSSLIRSGEYAREKIARIKNLEAAEEKGGPQDIETVPISGQFLLDPRLGPRLIRSISVRGLDIYLFFLWQFHETGKARFELDYEKLAAHIGLKDGAVRRKINRVLRDLKNRYGLIDYTLPKEKPTEVILLDYNDRSKEYKEPENDYFGVPKGFWEYGWSEKLDLKTKYCYLISVYNTERSKIKPWWSFSQNRLAEDFHLGIATVCRGLRELKKAGLLDVEYDDAVNEEGKFIGRDTNKYRLRPLFSQEMIDKQWADLRKEFTEEEVHKAGELAALIEEEHNVEKVKAFIQIMSIYGRDPVEKATKMVGRLKADNPCKNFGYIVGILKNWEKDGRVD